MTVSFGMTTPPGSENGGAVNSNGRRVLAAKIDSASNVNNNNNNNNNGNGNGNNGNINNNNNNNTAANNNNNNNINTAANANNNYNNGPAPNGPNAGKVSVLSVRRVLFGPPADRDETRAWLEQQLDAVTAANSESWNFDFDNERPMRDSPADRYSWERVCPKQPQPQQEQQPQPRIDGRDEASAAADPGQEQQDCRLKSSAATGKQRQSKVTDYMGKTKKRPLGGVNKIADEELAASGNNKRSRRSAATMMAI